MAPPPAFILMSGPITSGALSFNVGKLASHPAILAFAAISILVWAAFSILFTRLVRRSWMGLSEFVKGHQTSVKESAQKLSRKLVEFLAEHEHHRKFVVDYAVIAAIGFVAWAAWAELANTTFIVRPFDVAKSLSDRGLTGDVVAMLLRDRVRMLLSDVNRPRVLPDSYFRSPLTAIEIGETKLPLRDVIEFIREKVGLNRHTITGMIVPSDPDSKREAQYDLFLWLPGGDGEGRTFEKKNGTLNDLFEQAALEIDEYIDPYSAANYLSREKREHARALAVLYRMLADHQNIPWVYLEEGVIHRNQGEYGNSLRSLFAAEIAYERAHQGKRMPLAFDELATTELQMGEHVQALRSAITAVRKAKGNAYAPYFNKAGRILLDRNDFEEGPSLCDAFKAFKQASKTDANNGQAYQGLGESYARFTESFDKVTRPENRSCFEERTKTKEQAIAQAELYFATAAGLDPNPEQAFYQWGEMLLRIKDYPNAIKRYKLALDRKPEEHGFLLGLGKAYIGAGKSDLAAANLCKALLLKPTDNETAQQLLKALRDTQSEKTIGWLFRICGK